MTAKEHSLVVAMLFKQAQSMKFILDLLKTKGLIEQSDLAINSFATRNDPVSNKALYLETLEYYTMAAKELGIELP
jgi:hypothetical protein